MTALDRGITVVFLFLIALVLALLVDFVTTAPPSSPSPSSRPMPQHRTAVIATYREADRVLLVTHVPADLLICVGDEDHCRLGLDWRDR